MRKDPSPGGSGSPSLVSANRMTRSVNSGSSSAKQNGSTKLSFYIVSSRPPSVANQSVWRDPRRTNTHPSESLKQCTAQHPGSSPARLWSSRGKNSDFNTGLSVRFLHGARQRGAITPAVHPLTGFNRSTKRVLFADHGKSVVNCGWLEPP